MAEKTFFLLRPTLFYFTPAERRRKKRLVAVRRLFELFGACAEWKEKEFPASLGGLAVEFFGPFHLARDVECDLNVERITFLAFCVADPLRVRQKREVFFLSWTKHSWLRWSLTHDSAEAWVRIKRKTSREKSFLFTTHILFLFFASSVRLFIMFATLGWDKSTAHSRQRGKTACEWAEVEISHLLLPTAPLILNSNHWTTTTTRENRPPRRWWESFSFILFPPFNFFSHLARPNKTANYTSSTFFNIQKRLWRFRHTTWGFLRMRQNERAEWDVI